jgi:hypothetical protein
MFHSRIVSNVSMLVAVFLVAVAMPVEARALAQDESTPPAGEQVRAEPCSDGRLRVRDLEKADATLHEGIERTRELALAWEDDARLYAVELGCPLLMPGYLWVTTYFSETAQAFWRSGTAEVEAADNDPDTIKTLVTDNLSFQLLYRSLLRAGYGDDLVLNVTSGVTVRYNTEADLFGPPTAPKNAIYYHVAIEQRGEIADIWVSAVDGTIYRYEASGSNE